MLRLNLKYNSLVFCLLFTLFACDKNLVYEKNIDFENAQWELNDTLDFTTQIVEDTPVNLFINFRHDFDFNWRNIWVELNVLFPNDSIHTLPINIPLSQPNGKWFGEHSGDIYLVQFPIEAYSNYSFPDTGTYVFTLNHQMREIPLQHTLSAGIRIEKVENKK